MTKIQTANNAKEDKPAGTDKFEALKHHQSALQFGFPCQKKTPIHYTYKKIPKLTKLENRIALLRCQLIRHT